MADVKPFKSLLYNQDKVDLRRVIMPPYDIIKDKDIEGYYKKDPHNIIRIDKGLEEEGDGERANKYTRAADFMGEWMLDNVLARDDRDTFYVYTQEYKLPDGRKKEMISFFAAVKLEEFDKKIVLPHERTHSGPKVDRLLLMRATYSNTSPILSLYFDREKKAHSLLKAAIKKGKPFINIKNEAGLRMRMWRITDAKETSRLSAILAKKQLFIADGHHRYETALNFRNEMREKLGTKETPYDRILMCLISMENSGISILPTHRMFRTFRDFDPECAMMKKFFSVTKLKTTAALKKAMTRTTKKKLIGVVKDRIPYLLELKVPVYKKEIPKGQHIPQYYMLSASILHSLIFEKILGIPEKEIFSGIAYTQDLGEAVNSAFRGGFRVSFMVQPSTVDEVKFISLHAEVMPQKSTYFLPKLVTGFLINKMN
jgi:uncharacterized protein (DUF1015 family)